MKVTTIKNIARQTSKGWCSAFLIANIFRNDGYLSFLNDENYKGCDDEKVNNILKSQDDTKGLKVVTVTMLSEHYGALQKEFVYNHILLNDFNEKEQHGCEEVEFPITPYLMSVNLVPGTYHHVGVLVCGKRLIYIDPYFEHYIELESFEDFAGLFIGIREVQRFILDDGTDTYALLRGENMEYKLHLHEAV